MNEVASQNHLWVGTESPKRKTGVNRDQWIPVVGRGLGEDGVLGENFPFAEVFKPIFENQEF